MRSGPLIGILGASGAVGDPTASAIGRMDAVRLRLGARGPESLVKLGHRFGGRAEVVAVDICDDASLTRFCAGCRVVVNCAAAGDPQRTAVAASSLAAGADYVDPAGDGVAQARLAALPELAGRTAVLGVGVHPGLSELIPRWLATQGLDPPLILTSYIGTLDRMTRASAREFLLSLTMEHGEAHAMWRAGARRSHALEPLHEADIPFFPPAVLAYPYLSAHAERLARQLPLDEARCYYIFEAGGSILAVLSGMRERLSADTTVDVLTGELMRAVDIEMFGRKPAQQLVFELEGQESGHRASRVAVLRASSTYVLTATMVTTVVTEILAGALPTGAHFAAETLEPRVIAGLGGSPGVIGMHLLNQPLPAYERADQGVV